MTKKIIMFFVFTMIIMSTIMISLGASTLTITGSPTITLEATGKTTDVTPSEAGVSISGEQPPYSIVREPTSGLPIGDNTVTWTVTDTNSTDSMTQTVTIVDNTPPVIFINGDSIVEINEGNTYNELGAKAIDTVDGEFEATPSGTVNNNVAGTYTVDYNAVDSHGNNAIQQTRTVKVLAVSTPTPTPTPTDTSPPEINITGANPMNLNVGDTYVEEGATAYDDVDKDITDNITTTGKVDTKKVGIYEITYSVSDNAGNNAHEIRTINVSDVAIVDNTPPTITAPANIVKVAIGTLTIVSLGQPVVSDDIDPNPTVTNNAPTGGFPIGDNVVTWTATDNSGNSNNATQIVTIVSAPVKLAIIDSYPNASTVEDKAPSNIKFNITLNKEANVVWKLDNVNTPGGQAVTDDSFRTNIPTISSHTLTVTAQNINDSTDSVSKTWTWNVRGTMEVSAHPDIVNIGENTSVVLRVSRRCGIEKTDSVNCTGRIPVSGVSILLTGIVTASGNVNDTTGEYVTSINTTTNGTINVIARKSGYVDAYTNITSGTAPAPVPTTPPSSGGGGGGSSSGSSSGGGGGGGGSAEPYDNILKYEIQEHEVFTSPVSFAYKTPELAIYEVMVTSTQSDMAALRIEALRSTSKLINVSAPGVVYKNINAWIDYKRIKNATIRFKVENSWLSSNGITDSNVRMNKWDSVNKKWNELLTNVKNKDSQYTYFESPTDSFSSFAISTTRVLPTTNTQEISKSNTGTASGSSVPINASTEQSEDYTSLKLGAIAIIAVLVIYMLRMKKN